MMTLTAIFTDKNLNFNILGFYSCVKTLIFTSVNQITLLQKK